MRPASAIRGWGDWLGDRPDDANRAYVSWSGRGRLRLPRFVSVLEYGRGNAARQRGLVALDAFGIPSRAGRAALAHRRAAAAAANAKAESRLARGALAVMGRTVGNTAGASLEAIEAAIETRPALHPDRLPAVDRTQRRFLAVAVVAVCGVEGTRSGACLDVIARMADRDWQRARLDADDWTEGERDAWQVVRTLVAAEGTAQDWARHLLEPVGDAAGASDATKTAADWRLRLIAAERLDPGLRMSWRELRRESLRVVELTRSERWLDPRSAHTDGLETWPRAWTLERRGVPRAAVERRIPAIAFAGLAHRAYDADALGEVARFTVSAVRNGLFDDGAHGRFAEAAELFRTLVAQGRVIERAARGPRGSGGPREASGPSVVAHSAKAVRTHRPTPRVMRALEATRDLSRVLDGVFARAADLPGLRDAFPDAALRAAVYRVEGERPLEQHRVYARLTDEELSRIRDDVPAGRETDVRRIASLPDREATGRRLLPMLDRAVGRLERAAAARSGGGTDRAPSADETGSSTDTPLVEGLVEGILPPGTDPSWRSDPNALARLGRIAVDRLADALGRLHPEKTPPDADVRSVTPFGALGAAADGMRMGSELSLSDERVRGVNLDVIAPVLLSLLGFLFGGLLPVPTPAASVTSTRARDATLKLGLASAGAALRFDVGQGRRDSASAMLGGGVGPVSIGGGLTLARASRRARTLQLRMVRNGDVVDRTLTRAAGSRITAPAGMAGDAVVAGAMGDLLRDIDRLGDRMPPSRLLMKLLAAYPALSVNVGIDESQTWSAAGTLREGGGPATLGLSLPPVFGPALAQRGTRSRETRRRGESGGAMDVLHRSARSGWDGELVGSLRGPFGLPLADVTRRPIGSGTSLEFNALVLDGKHTLGTSAKWTVTNGREFASARSRWFAELGERAARSNPRVRPAVDRAVDRAMENLEADLARATADLSPAAAALYRQAVARGLRRKAEAEAAQAYARRLEGNHRRTLGEPQAGDVRLDWAQLRPEAQRRLDDLLALRRLAARIGDARLERAAAAAYEATLTDRDEYRSTELMLIREHLTRRSSSWPILFERTRTDTVKRNDVSSRLF